MKTNRILITAVLATLTLGACGGGSGSDETVDDNVGPLASNSEGELNVPGINTDDMDANSQAETNTDSSVVDSVCIDTPPLGDGWGWNGIGSCQVIMDNTQIDTDASNSDPALELEPQPQPQPILGDFNGNGVADGFEASITGGPDEDGDAIDDRVDSSIQNQLDENNNGIVDAFENMGSRDNELNDVDRDGVVDYAFPPPFRAVVPDPKDLEPTIGELLFELEYEDGSAGETSGAAVTRPDNAEAIAVTDSVARAGGNSLKTTMRYQDDYISFDRHRAESATASRDLRNLGYGAGETWRYEFSLFLDPSWKMDHVWVGDIAWQFKSWEFSWPNMTVAVVGKELQLVVTDISRLTEDSGPDHKKITLMRDYRTGEWIDIRLDITFSTSNDGLIKPSIRYASEESYTALSEYRGRNLLQDGACCSYLKWGNYSPSLPNTVIPEHTRVFYHDSIRVMKIDG